MLGRSPPGQWTLAPKGMSSWVGGVFLTTFLFLHCPDSPHLARASLFEQPIGR